MLHAKQLGKLMAQKNIRLIYGGGNSGLMGAVSGAVMENAGEVVGIIPEVLTGWERQHDGITELIVVENMHIRKRMLYEKCDAAIILPGGFGTLDELFEMLTWNQLSIHDKPIYVINSGGFYNTLLQHMQTMMQEGFLYHLPADAFTLLNDPEELFEEHFN